MYCPELLRINQHRVVDIPDGKAIFGRVGSTPLSGSMYSGDEEIPQSLSKTEQLAATERELDAEYQRMLEREGK